MAGPVATGFARQLARPSGLAGNLLGRAMDLANRRCTSLALDLLAPIEGERILDAGCGTGAALAALRRRWGCQTYGVDPSPTMIAAARRRLGHGAGLSVGKIEALPPGLPAFDGVLALNVLYFAGHDGAMAAGLYRALATGGRLVAYVTHLDTMERWSFVHAGIHRLFDAEMLATLLQQGGFASDAISVQECIVGPGVKGLLACARR